VLELYKFIHQLDSSYSCWVPSEEASLENYELMLSYPKVKLQMDKTIEESDCYPNCTIFVREDID
jgi:hypothetical protein